MFTASIVTGLSIWAASLIALISTGGIVVGLRSKAKIHTVGAPIFAALVLGIDCWLSTKFSLSLYHWQISGLAWIIIGGVIGMLWGNASAPLS
jgi:hypothetical protein